MIYLPKKVTFISCLLGGTHLASSVEISPSGIWFKHCSIILKSKTKSNTSNGIQGGQVFGTLLEFWSVFSSSLKNKIKRNKLAQIFTAQFCYSFLVLKFFIIMTHVKTGTRLLRFVVAKYDFVIQCFSTFKNNGTIDVSFLTLFSLYFFYIKLSHKFLFY